MGHRERDAGAGQHLEAALLRTPADEQLWRIYSDWLQERGDPRGELVRVDLQLEEGGADPQVVRRRSAIIERYEPLWLGEDFMAVLRREKMARFPAVTVAWKRAFLRSLGIVADRSRGVDLEVLLAGLTERSTTRFIEELKLSDDSGRRVAEAVLQLAGNGPLSLLEEAYLYARADPQTVSHPSADLSGLGVQAPNLRMLWVVGGVALGSIDHPRLETLHVGLQGTARMAAAESLSQAKLPALAGLRLDFNPNWGPWHEAWDLPARKLAGVLEGTGYPRLEQLRLWSPPEGVVVAVLRAPIVDRLEELRLVGGVVSRAVVDAMLEQRDRLERLSGILIRNTAIRSHHRELLEARFGPRIDISGEFGPTRAARIRRQVRRAAHATKAVVRERF